ncbi:MAG: phosphoribosylamine--glycine ligase, partial [Cyclobacteriaceae bacterium]
MNILLIGSGGREHAFAWKINQSKHCEKLLIAPGNAGTSQLGQNMPFGVSDFDAIKDCVIKEGIDLIVVGPEEPLVKGLRDFLGQDNRTSHLPIVGPGSRGARLEGSKDFSKKFMQKNQIPTAAYESFTRKTLENGLAYIKKQSLPIVLKADGLAAGKGVLICQSHQEAEISFKEMLLDQKFGEASSKVVVETFLQGIELSVFVATDGESYTILPEAKDYKRIGDQDKGPNTGGMGAISPVPFANQTFMGKVEEKIVKPTINGLKAEGIDYRGFLFIGLMNVNGEPFVIEYNVRMGDPETQAVLPRIKSDFVELLWSIATKKLGTYTLELENFVTATVVMVAGGYPGAYEKGNRIEGLLQKESENAITFHAGTLKGPNADVLTNGGRVLGITGIGKTIKDAINQAYLRVIQISWDKVNFRKDIGKDIL